MLDILKMVLITIIVAVVPVVAWFNHIITCFQEELWGFLIAGAIMFPIGIIHGIWLWF
jgi:hypothetical protein